MIPAHGYDFVQWTPETRGLYESNYLKANSPDGKRGLWLKHNILAPTGEHEAVLELWCVLFDKDKGRPRALKQTRLMSQFDIAQTSLSIQGKEVTLTAHRTETTIRDKSGKTATWALELTPEEDPIFHLPIPRMYTASFPKKKLITPAPRLRFNGTLEFDGETVEVEDWIGIRGHNWGTEHAFSYAYGNCNLFKEDPSVCVDMFTAKIKLGPVKSPWLSGGVFRKDGEQHDFNGLRYTITRKAIVKWPQWVVTLRDKDQTLAAEWALDPEQTVGLHYMHPDGKLSYCYNTKFADLRLRVGGETFTSDQAELEFLFAEPIDGIPLFGEGEL